MQSGKILRAIQPKPGCALLSVKAQQACCVKHVDVVLQHSISTHRPLNRHTIKSPNHYWVVPSDWSSLPVFCSWYRKSRHWVFGAIVLFNNSNPGHSVCSFEVYQVCRCTNTCSLEWRAHKISLLMQILLLNVTLRWVSAKTKLFLVTSCDETPL